MLNISPIINQRLKGDESEPYIAMQENLTIKNQKVQLSGVPDYLSHVYITDMSEIFSGLPNENEFIVDYRYGYITFNLANDNQNINVSYVSTGCSFFPADRVYTKEQNNNIEKTLQNYIEAIDAISGSDLHMQKIQYDSNNDGKVNNADNADNASLLENHPASYFATKTEINSHMADNAAHGGIQHKNLLHNWDFSMAEGRCFWPCKWHSGLYGGQMACIL